MARCKITLTPSECEALKLGHGIVEIQLDQVYFVGELNELNQPVVQSASIDKTYGRSPTLMMILEANK